MYGKDTCTQSGDERCRGTGKERVPVQVERGLLREKKEPFKEQVDLSNLHRYLDR